MSTKTETKKEYFDPRSFNCLAFRFLFKNRKAFLKKLVDKILCLV